MTETNRLFPADLTPVTVNHSEHVQKKLMKTAARLLVTALVPVLVFTACGQTDNPTPTPAAGVVAPAAGAATPATTPAAGAATPATGAASPVAGATTPVAPTTGAGTPAAGATTPVAPAASAGTPTTGATPVASAGTPTTGAATPAAGATVAAPTQQGGFIAVNVFQQNQNSVVSVNSIAMQRVQGGGTAGRPAGVGSGFVFDDQGHIITNNHVIERADELTITLSGSGGQNLVVPAELIGRDPPNDLAVVKVDPNATMTNGRRVGDILRPATLGRMADVQVGEPVVAMGAPLGLAQTVTSGIVSAIRAPGSEVALGLELLGGAIQTDAPVNPGNSGGPLFNSRGQVIGVNTAGLSQSGGSIGLNFAIPVDVVTRVAPELIAQGCYRHPLVGVATVPLSVLGQATKRQLGLPTDQDGLLVQEASAGAAEAGVRAGDRTAAVNGQQLRVGGDIILAIDGQAISTGGDLLAYVENNKRPGETVTLTVLRNGQRQDVPVQLTERPSDVC
jgi:2-alkenal reductase